jgi:hypothetical protein
VQYGCPDQQCTFDASLSLNAGGAPLPPKTLVRDSSATAPYALLLFGGPVAVRHEETLVTVGTHGWIRFL